MNTEDFPFEWAVVMTVSEPSELVLANVAYHLAQGASEVFVFLDTPDPLLEAALNAHPKCKAMHCDSEYWQVRHAMKRPPARHTRRQTMNADLAATITNCAWLLNIDADEFLWCEGAFSSLLAEVPKDAGWVKLRPWERRRDWGAKLEGLFDGHFLALNSQPDEGPLTEGGFTGHVVGKGCVRTNRGYSLTLHNPRIGPVSEKKIPRAYENETAFLLHFDGLTPLHWANKLLLRAERGAEHVQKNYRGKRLRQIHLAAYCVGDRQKLMALQEHLTGFSPEHTEVLLGEGKLRNLNLSIPAALAKHFPNETRELSTVQFDAKLISEFEKMCARIKNMGDVWGAET